MIDITNAGDLRTAYLQTYDSFALEPGDIVESSEGRVNMRYARELLGTLVNAGLVTVTEGGDGQDVWQTFPDTYDTMTREEAEAKIDAWLKGTKSTDSAPTTTRSSGRTSKMPKNESGVCLCGCGGTTKSNYRPGHDARHAGVVGREIAANYSTPGFDRRELLAALPTDALKAKAEGIAEKAIEKASKKAESGSQIENGIIKVGKKEFVATRTSDGQVTYFDGEAQKQASKTAAKTFTVG